MTPNYHCALLTKIPNALEPIEASETETPRVAVSWLIRQEVETLVSLSLSVVNMTTLAITRSLCDSLRALIVSAFTQANRLLTT